MIKPSSLLPIVIRCQETTRQIYNSELELHLRVSKPRRTFHRFGRDIHDNDGRSRKCCIKRMIVFLCFALPHLDCGEVPEPFKLQHCGRWGTSEEVQNCWRHGESEKFEKVLWHAFFWWVSASILTFLPSLSQQFLLVVCITFVSILTLIATFTPSFPHLAVRECSLNCNDSKISGLSSLEQGGSLCHLNAWLLNWSHTAAQSWINFGWVLVIFMMSHKFRDTWSYLHHIKYGSKQNVIGTMDPAETAGAWGFPLTKIPIFEREPKSVDNVSRWGVSG